MLKLILEADSKYKSDSILSNATFSAFELQMIKFYFFTRHWSIPCDEWFSYRSFLTSNHNGREPEAGGWVLYNSLTGTIFLSIYFVLSLSVMLLCFMVNTLVLSTYFLISCVKSIAAWVTSSPKNLHSYALIQLYPKFLKQIAFLLILVCSIPLLPFISTFSLVISNRARARGWKNSQELKKKGADKLDMKQVNISEELICAIITGYEESKMRHLSLIRRLSFFHQSEQSEKLITLLQNEHFSLDEKADQIRWYMSKESNEGRQLFVNISLAIKAQENTSPIAQQVEEESPVGQFKGDFRLNYDERQLRAELEASRLERKIMTIRAERQYLETKELLRNSLSELRDIDSVDAATEQRLKVLCQQVRSHLSGKAEAAALSQEQLMVLHQLLEGYRSSPAPSDSDLTSLEESVAAVLLAASAKKRSLAGGSGHDPRLFLPPDLPPPGQDKLDPEAKDTAGAAPQ